MSEESIVKELDLKALKGLPHQYFGTRKSLKDGATLAVMLKLRTGRIDGYWYYQYSVNNGEVSILSHGTRESVIRDSFTVLILWEKEQMKGGA